MNNDFKSWTFTCRTCGGHTLTVTHIWATQAGTEREWWQEWGPLEAGHHWHFQYKEKVEKNPGDINPQDNLGEFYVNCTLCDREIEFGWSQPYRGGRIFPVECSDFAPAKLWPDSRYLHSWRRKRWLRPGIESRE